jgi:plasmid stabilization system protein ParE
MKVVFSRRFERELDRHFREGVQRFGVKVASAMFLKIDRAFRMTLAGKPRAGVFVPTRRCYRYNVASIPFVIYYQIRDDQLVVLAIRHGVQDRSEFERP